MFRLLHVSLIIPALLIAGFLLLAALEPGAVKSSNLAQNPCNTFTPINFGQDVTGTLQTTDCRLSDGSFADIYSFAGFSGQQIAITLDSTAFDAYLFLLSSAAAVLAENDDGGGGTNARIPATSGFFTLPSTGLYLIAANSFGPGETGAYTLRLTTTGATVASVSAASFTGGLLAPESVTAAFGSGLATQTVAATTQPLPTTLGGVTVEVTDSAGQNRPAPLFFVAPTQINYVMPAGTASGVAVVRVTSGGSQVAQGAVQIAAVAPALFAANANGQGVAAAVALRIRGGVQSFEPVAQFDPAQNRFVPTPIDLGPETDQVFLVLFGTGLRSRSALSAVSLTVGGAAAEVQAAGAQGEFAGLDQVNGRLPRSLIGRGEVDVALTVDARTANVVRVSIR